MEKFKSRKFLISVAAFLHSIAISIGGLATGNAQLATFGVVCSIVSAAIYAACEAWVDASHCNDIVLEDDEE